MCAAEELELLQLYSPTEGVDPDVSELVLCTSNLLAIGDCREVLPRIKLPDASMTVGVESGLAESSTSSALPAPI